MTFRVSAANRADLERDAADLGISVNELARRRALRRDGRCVDIGDSATEQRDLTVEYDQADGPIPDVGR